MQSDTYVYIYICTFSCIYVVYISYNNTRRQHGVKTTIKINQPTKISVQDIKITFTWKVIQLLHFLHKGATQRYNKNEQPNITNTYIYIYI